MSKSKLTIVVLVVALMFIGLLFAITSLSYQRGVKLSCKEGNFVSFVNIGMPYNIAVVPGSCSGKILIKNPEGEIVCETSDYNSEDDEVVEIPCSNLKKYKNQNLTIDFWTYSIDYGNQTGTINTPYPQK